MTTLRRRLQVSLWHTVAVVGVVSAVFTFFEARYEANALLDYQMEQVATLVGAQTFSAGTAPQVTPAAVSRDDDDDDGYLVSVRDASGKEIYSSGRSMKELPLDWLGYRTVRIGDDDYRVFCATAGTQRVAVAQEVDVRQETAAGAALYALLPVMLLVPTLGLVISTVIRRQLRPLATITHELTQREPRALEPLPLTGLPDEVLPLFEEMNRLLQRLRVASDHEQRFVADSAHALRTPLAALQLQVDVLDGSTDGSERATRTAELRSGIRRAVRLCNHLLQLVHSEPQVASIAGSTEIDDALLDTYELYAPIAWSRGIDVQLNAVSEATVPGDARHLAQITGNLLENALRHTPNSGKILARVRREAHEVRIDIVDEGPGLPGTELERVFERFYRVPGDLTEGSGLGLAVVRSVAERLGGRVALANRSDRRGLIASVWLPLVNPVSASPASGASR